MVTYISDGTIQPNASLTTPPTRITIALRNTGLLPPQNPVFPNRSITTKKALENTNAP